MTLVLRGDLLDLVELAQAPKVADDAPHGESGQEARQICPANALNVELWTLQDAQQSLLRRVEEVEALEGMAVDGTSKPWLKDSLGNVGQVRKVSPNSGLKVTIPVSPAVSAASRRTWV